MLIVVALLVQIVTAIDCGNTDHDGWFCGFNKVQLCVSKTELTHYSCGGQGCVQSKCDYNIGFCQGRLNQWYCDTKNNQLQLQCQNGEQNPVSFSLCSGSLVCTQITGGVNCTNRTVSNSSGSTLKSQYIMSVLVILLILL